MALGGAVLVGWAVDSPMLKGAIGHPITMKANAAVCFLLAGMSLWLAVSRAGPRLAALGRVLGALVAAIGAATFAEHLTSRDLGIDQLLFTEPPGEAGTASPGRMGPPASLSFVLIGLALAALGKNGLVRHILGHLPLIAILLSLISISGYLYGSTDLYAVAHFTGIAWPTAVALLVLSVGTMAAQPSSPLVRTLCASDVGGMAARRMLLPSIVIPVLLLFLYDTGRDVGVVDPEAGRALIAVLMIVALTGVLLVTAQRLERAAAKQRRTEAELRRRERELTRAESESRRLSAIVESSNDAIVGADLSGRISSWNRGAERVFGYSADETIGRQIDAVIAAADGSGVPTRRLRPGAEPFEIAVRRKDGTPIEASVSVSPILEGESQAVGTSLIVRDVTERRRMEAALRASEDALRKAVNIGTVGVLFFNLDGRIVGANQAFEKMSGYSLEQLTKFAHWRQLTSNEFLGATAKAAADLAVDGVAAPYEKQLVRSDGSRWWGLFAPTRLSGTGSDSQCVEFVIDITVAKQTEAAVRASEARYRTLVENLRDYAIFMLDPDGRVTEWTAGAQKVKGYSADEVVGRHLAMFFTPEAVAAGEPQRLLEEAARDGRSERDGWRVHKSGERLWMNEIASAVRDASGQLVGYTQISRDLTARRRIEEALRDADRRKDEFIATLAHELRNPLAPLSNGIQIVRLANAPDAPIQRTIEMMDRQLSHLVHLVDDLLDVGRIRSGKIQLRHEVTTLGEILASSAEASRAAIEEQEHEFIVEGAEEQLRVWGDPDRLIQVFANLLSNAAKYTEREGAIRLKLARDGNEAVISVSDNGIGIPAEDLPHVFDLFSQVRTHLGRAQGGLGIGLSLVRTLVEMHGGSVTATSGGENQGSTFTVRLPLLKETRAPVKASDAACGTSMVSRRVLVVDDNEDAASSLAAVLEHHGHEVAVAHDGVESIDKARAFHPDLIFLDLGMPRMDGIEAAQHLRALPDGDRIMLVALTGWGQERDHARTKEAGFDMHILKPADQGALLLALAAQRAPQA